MVKKNRSSRGARSAKTPAPRARIPYVNIAGQSQAIKVELLNAVSGVLQRGQFILGEEVKEFEQRFAALCGTRFAVAVGLIDAALSASLTRFK